MKITLSTVALLALTSNLLVAGGNILEPMEPSVTIPEKEVVVVDNNVRYNGFYLGGALSYLRLNEATELRGNALTILGGYYLNRYIGIEARYTQTLTDVDEDQGRVIVSRDKELSNVGIYIKPMFNLTTGFSLYGLAGYGQAKAGTLEERGGQWGIGSKYELANGVGIFFDYMSFYEGDDFANTNVTNTFFSSTTVGATYSF